MNRKAYELANRIETELGTDGITLTESPGNVKMEQCGGMRGADTACRNGNFQ